MTYTIDDLEKALRYAKKQHAVVVCIERDSTSSRLIISVSEAYRGAGAKITIYEADAAKMPEITHTETLFT